MMALDEIYKNQDENLVNSIDALKRDFLTLRSDKSALWEIRELAQKVYKNLPDEHKYLFKDCIKKEKLNP